MELFHQQTYGIDISDHSIELLGIRKKLGRPTVAAASRVELSSGVVDNGTIQQPELFVKALKRLAVSAGIDRHHVRRVILGVPESQIYLSVFTVPPEVSSLQIGESVQFMAEEHMPLSFDQVYHDYHVLSRTAEGTDVLYVACAKPVVDTLRQLCGQAGITPAVIEPESAALARSIIPAGPVPPTLIADIGSRSTIITIYDRHGIRYSYALPVAGHAFTKALMQSHGISIEEAVRLKRERLLDVSKSNNELREPLQQIVDRMSRSIQYYEHKTGFAVTQILLAGGSSLLPGIDEYIHNQLRLPTSVGKPLAGIAFNRSMFPDAQRLILYATVTGLALRGMTSHALHQGLNLLRHETTHRQLALGTLFHSLGAHVQQQPKQPRRSKRKPSTNPKRMRLLLAVFVALIVIFFLVLIIRPNG